MRDFLRGTWSYFLWVWEEGCFKVIKPALNVVQNRMLAMAALNISIFRLSCDFNFFVIISFVLILIIMHQNQAMSIPHVSEPLVSNTLNCRQHSSSTLKSTRLRIMGASLTCKDGSRLSDGQMALLYGPVVRK